MIAVEEILCTIAGSLVLSNKSQTSMLPFIVPRKNAEGRVLDHWPQVYLVFPRGEVIRGMSDRLSDSEFWERFQIVKE